MASICETTADTANTVRDLAAIRPECFCHSSPLRKVDQLSYRCALAKNEVFEVYRVNGKCGCTALLHRVQF